MTSSAVTNGHVIRTRALTKRYGDLRAVDSVNLEVRAGDVYGFLGANGSGKTTTVRMLLGLVLPTSGEAEVLGMPMPSARRATGSTHKAFKRSEDCCCT
jgi:ABC-2 type transport system ATP-binding protein